ncbi:HIT domain-containing protein [Streptomyces olivoreticuli]
MGPEAVSDFYCNEALNGRTPVRVVIETPTVLAFHHTNPSHPVHIVVVPRDHIPSLADLGDADPARLDEVLDVVRQVAAQVETEYGACTVVTNLGRYQESKNTCTGTSSTTASRADHTTGGSRCLTTS